jgi:hypothetical protein
MESGQTDSDCGMDADSGREDAEVVPKRAEQRLDSGLDPSTSSQDFPDTADCELSHSCDAHTITDCTQTDTEDSVTQTKTPVNEGASPASSSSS